MKSSNRNSQYREIKSQNRDSQPGGFDKSAFAARVREKMEDLRVTDTEISRRSGVPTSNMSRYLKGESEPKSGYIVPLADALDVNIRWLLTGEGPAERTDREPPPSAEQEAWLVADYRLLPESNRMVLKAVLDSMLGRLIDVGHPLMQKGDPSTSKATLHAGKTAFRGESDEK